MSATFCLSPKMLANLRAIRTGEPWPHLDTAVPQFAAIPPNFLVKGSPWRLTPDGAAVLALADERDALRKRVADFEHLLTEPKVEQARLLALRDLSEKLYTDGSGYTTVEARQDEILSAFLDVVDEALAANLHRRLNKGVAGALGLLEMQKDPETGESYLPSWHDMPDRVAALVQEGEALRAEMAYLLKPAVDIDLRGALANVRALRALLGIPAAERTTGERADIEALYADMTEAMGMVLSEIPRLRAAVRFADEQGAEAIERVSRQIVADKWNSTADLQAEVERLRARVQEAETRADNAYAEGLSDGQTAAERECDAGHEAQPDPEKVAAFKAEMERVCAQFQETRLTLLAEHGKPEGAPPGWSYIAGDPDLYEPGEWINKAMRLKVWRTDAGPGWVWGREIAGGAYRGAKDQPDDQFARVAMLAAMAYQPNG